MLPKVAYLLGQKLKSHQVRFAGTDRVDEADVLPARLGAVRDRHGAGQLKVLEGGDGDSDAGSRVRSGPDRQSHIRFARKALETCVVKSQATLFHGCARKGTVTEKAKAAGEEKKRADSPADALPLPSGELEFPISGAFEFQGNEDDGRRRKDKKKLPQAGAQESARGRKDNIRRPLDR